MSTPLPDTGGRTEFDTGARRDASVGKGLPSNIPPGFLRELAVRYEQGRDKYANIDERTPNWMLGIPLSRYIDSAFRHLMAMAEGDKTENHAAAVGWNAAGFWWTEKAIEEGRLPASLNDLPFFEEGVADAVSLEEAPEYLQEHKLPPVPHGFFQWKDRGRGWKSPRPVVFAVLNAERVDPKWFPGDDPCESEGRPENHYLEAIKGHVNVGDTVRVTFMHTNNEFEDTITGIRHIRGVVVYDFAGRAPITSDSIYSITPISE